MCDRKPLEKVKLGQHGVIGSAVWCMTGQGEMWTQENRGGEAWSPEMGVDGQ